MTIKPTCRPETSSWSKMPLPTAISGLSDEYRKPSKARTATWREEGEGPESRRESHQDPSSSTVPFPKRRRRVNTTRNTRTLICLSTFIRYYFLVFNQLLLEQRLYPWARSVAFIALSYFAQSYIIFHISFISISGVIGEFGVSGVATCPSVFIRVNINSGVYTVQFKSEWSSLTWLYLYAYQM